MKRDKFRLSLRGRIFIACFISYICLYLCRINLSAAFPALNHQFENGTAVTGMIGSAFFITYAIGHLINGYLGDKGSPKIFVSVALLSSAFFNFIIGLSDSHYVILVCWAFNCVFQSMVWGPVMRILSRRYSSEEQRSVGIGMSATLVVGYILAWGRLSVVIMHSSRRMAFLLPAGILCISLALWMICIPSDRTEPELFKRKKKRACGRRLHISPNTGFGHTL